MTIATAAAPRRRSRLPADPGTRLEAVIQDRGLKRSRPRELITRAFFAMGGHVAVDALVARVRELDPRVSVATVYRTMKLLEASGLAVAQRFGDGQTRYEPAARPGSDEHAHLICTGCGAIVEFESRRIAELEARVAQRHGFALERRRVELYGRCPRCRRPAEVTP